MRAGWSTAGQQEGIWAAGGMASDGNGVFAVTGNNGSAPTTHDDSEEIVRVDGLAVAHHDDGQHVLPRHLAHGHGPGRQGLRLVQPRRHHGDGRHAREDASSRPRSPATSTSSTAPTSAAWPGQVRDIVVANTGAESVYTAPTVYKSPSGLRIAITTTIGANCPGAATDSQIIGLKLDTARTRSTRAIAWCAPTNGDDEIRRRSPVVDDDATARRTRSCGS